MGSPFLAVEPEVHVFECRTAAGEIEENLCVLV